MRIESKSGASKVGRINGRVFNFNVAPLLIGIWCPLISRVGDVWRYMGNVKYKGQVRRFGSRVEGSG